AGNSLIGSSFLISKVYFPRLTIPLSRFVVELADMGVAGLLLFALMLWYRLIPGPQIVLLPVVLVLVTLLAVGTGLWLAALNVEYRDLRVLIPFVLQLAMYATPVVYPLALLPERYRAAVTLNPMTGIVEGFRAALFGTPIPATQLLVSAIFASLLTISGLFYFRRMERLFADVL
ncbi:MAG TPA: ABC transporter permease, partial [Thermoanaerobaculia bacterium]